MNTALLVIDVQQSFAARPTFHSAELPDYLAAQNRLITGARLAGLPLVRVLHEEHGAGNPFAPASGLVRPLDGLTAFDADHTVRKTRHSALVGTGLEVWLVERGIRRLIVSGIRTEQCCETTARHASDLGWQVLFVPEATMTWDVALPPIANGAGGTGGAGGDGRVLTCAEIRTRTIAALHDRFARVLSVDDALRHATDH